MKKDPTPGATSLASHWNQSPYPVARPQPQGDERRQLRIDERRLDIEIRRDPPPHGRVWSEHRPGFHGKCARCHRIGRRWVGAYFVYVVAPEQVPYTVHTSDPLCIYHVTELQRAEWGVPHWRSEAVHAAIGHA